MDDWIGHFVEEERQRQRTRLLRTAVAAQEAENAALHVRKLMASLGARVSGDVENFARAFPERRLLYRGPSRRRVHRPAGPLSGSEVDGRAKRGQWHHHPQLRLRIAIGRTGSKAKYPGALGASRRLAAFSRRCRATRLPIHRAAIRVPPRPRVHRPAPVGPRITRYDPCRKNTSIQSAARRRARTTSPGDMVSSRARMSAAIAHRSSGDDNSAQNEPPVGANESLG